MVVEDDPLIADLVSRVGTECGFLTLCTTGSQVATAYPKFNPDIVVLDIIMPDVDGIEVLRYLKDQYKRLHVIILSGSPDSYRRMTHSLGLAIGFIVAANIPKPFRVTELRAAFEKIKSSFPDEQCTA